MKKMVLCSLLLFLCLFLFSASAEPQCSIEEIKNDAISSWQATYKTKWRTVEVNVQPTIPDVQSIPVLKVTPAFWIPTALDQVEWIAEIPHEEEGNDAFTLSSGDLYGEERTVAKKNVKVHTENIYVPLDADYPYAPQNDLTVHELKMKIQEIKSSMDNLAFDIDTEHLFYVGITSYQSKQTEEAVLPASMMVHLPIMLRNVPVWGHVITSVESHKDNELFYSPEILFTMRDADTYLMLGRAVSEQAELTANVSLCPLNQVIQALEQEITAGHIRQVFSLDLGLALYNEPGKTRKSGRDWMKTAGFYAAPTWRCTCLYSKLSKKDLPDSAFADPVTSMYFKTIYVDAQTGRLIDPNNGKKGCGDYQGPISWKEMK